MAGITNTDNTIADKLTDLVDAKEDMKDAIISMGVTPTGGLSTYAECISQSIEADWHTRLYFELRKLYDMPTSKSIIAAINRHIDYYAAQLEKIEDFAALRQLLHDDDIIFPPYFDTSSETDMGSLLRGGMDNLTKPCAVVFPYSLDNARDIGLMCTGAHNLLYMPKVNADYISNAVNAFNGCIHLSHIGGFTNLGLPEETRPPLLNTVRYTDMFYVCRNISRESMLNIFNGLYDIASAGYLSYPYALSFSYAVFDRLTPADIAIATKKGWTITSI